MKILLVLLLLEGLAGAQPRSAEDLYSDGQDAYDRKDYATAVTAWQAAYDQSHVDAMLFNVAQAQRLAGRCRAAIETYRRFLATKETEQRDLAEEWNRELELTCSQTHMPAKTRPVIATSLFVEPRVTPIPRSSSPWKTAGLVTAGAGIVTLAVGLGLGYHGSSIGIDVEAECLQGCDWAMAKGAEDRGRRYTTIGTALDVVGGLAIGGGVLFYYLGMRDDSAVTVTPTSDRDGGVLAWSGSW